MHNPFDGNAGVNNKAIHRSSRPSRWSVSDGVCERTRVMARSRAANSSNAGSTSAESACLRISRCSASAERPCRAARRFSRITRRSSRLRTCKFLGIATSRDMTYMIAYNASMSRRFYRNAKFLFCLFALVRTPLASAPRSRRRGSRFQPSEGARQGSACPQRRKNCERPADSGAKAVRATVGVPEDMVGERKQRDRRLRGGFHPAKPRRYNVFAGTASDALDENSPALDRNASSTALNKFFLKKHLHFLKIHLYSIA